MLCLVTLSTSFSRISNNFIHQLRHPRHPLVAASKHSRLDILGTSEKVIGSDVCLWYVLLVGALACEERNEGDAVSIEVLLLLTVPPKQRKSPRDVIPKSLNKLDFHPEKILQNNTYHGLLYTRYQK